MIYWIDYVSYDSDPEWGWVVDLPVWFEGEPLADWLDVVHTIYLDCNRVARDHIEVVVTEPNVHALHIDE